MTYTLYDGTIVVAQGILTSLSHILHQAEQYPDMHALLQNAGHGDLNPLGEHVRLATEFSEDLAARLAGKEQPVTFETHLTTYTECYERIAAVLDVFTKVDRSVVDGQVDVVATTLCVDKKSEMNGAKYAHLVALPNIYFHFAAVYGILRKQGVPLDKRDYFEGFFAQEGREAGVKND